MEDKIYNIINSSINSNYSNELYFDKSVNEIYNFNENNIDDGEYLTISERLVQINGYDVESGFAQILNKINYNENYYNSIKFK